MRDIYFQVWKLKVRKDKRAIVRGYDDNKLIVSQKIDYTDFPLDQVKLYLIDGVLMLPKEY